MEVYQLSQADKDWLLSQLRMLVEHRFTAQSREEMRTVAKEELEKLVSRFMLVVAMPHKTD